MVAEIADLELSITPLGHGLGMSLRLMEPDIRHGPFAVALERESLLAQSGDMPAYGAALRDMLFVDPAARAAFLACRAAGLGAGKRLRLRLLLPPEFQALRWEALLDPHSGRGLACDGDVLLSRYLSGDDYTPLQLRPKGHLRALVTVAAPNDAQDYRLAPIDAAVEAARVTAALGALRPTIMSASWAQLSDALREGCDILYLVAHGELVGDQAWLYLVDEQGNTDRRRGGELADLLRSLDAERRPRLVLLGSCESAGDSNADAMAALGPLLARAGVPAVLAMQGKLTMATNERLAPVFFRELLRGGVVDQAMNAARLVVQDRLDWWMPVLYTRLPGGALWQEDSGESSTELSTLYQLDSPQVDFVGRKAEIAELVVKLSSNGRAAIAGIAGMGGIGKSSLAMQVGYELRDQYTDARILLAMRGSREFPLSSVQALQEVIRAIRPNIQLPDDEQALTAMYRSLLAGKRVLIVADDAKDATQVKLLTPPPGSALLITSRQRFLLDGMERIDLERLKDEESIALLGKICDRLNEGKAHQISAACGRLPLALRIAGGVLANDKTLSMERYLEGLADEKRRLAALKDPDDPDLNVEASITLSYNLLSNDIQTTLRRLGVFAASFDLEAASAALEEIDQESLVTKLGLLYRRSLVEFVQGRYSFHDLVRVFALSKLGDEERAARLRHANYYAAIAAKIYAAYANGDTGDSLSQFRLEKDEIKAAWKWSLDQDDTECDNIAVNIGLDLQDVIEYQYSSDWVREKYEKVLESAERIGSGMINALNKLAQCASKQGGYDNVRAYMRRARELNGDDLMTRALLYINEGNYLLDCNRLIEAYDAALRGMELGQAENLSGPDGMYMARLNLGVICYYLQDLQAAETFFTALLDDTGSDGPHPSIVTKAQLNRAAICLDRGVITQARTDLEAALGGENELSFIDQAELYRQRSRLALAEGDLDQARRDCKKARECIGNTFLGQQPPLASRIHQELEATCAQIPH